MICGHDPTSLIGLDFRDTLLDSVGAIMQKLLCQTMQNCMLSGALKVVPYAEDIGPDMDRGWREGCPGRPGEQRVDPALAAVLLEGVCGTLRHQCDGGAANGQLNDVFETKILAF
jgi:hypothetical protein